MTLNERFQQWFINDEEDEHYEGMVELVSIEHEKLADEFAIGFAEWCRDNAVRETTYSTEFTNNWELRYEQKIITTKELLEIYKKEKGL